MMHRLRGLAILLVAGTTLTGAAVACSFQTSPISTERYYRSEGWSLPGIADGKLSSAQRDPALPGVRWRNVSYDERYVAQFAAQDFDRDGKRARMASQRMLLQSLVRYEADGKPMAYTYVFTPVEARRVGKKWIIEAEALCVFHATFVDEKGDGVFRLLVTTDMRPELVPAWAHKPKG